MSNRNYGWRPSHPTINALRLVSPGLPESELPQSVDLRDQFPAVYDQGQLGSCTANAIAAAIQHQCIKNKYKWQFTPSRLFIYYNEREIEGTTQSDSGASIADGINSVNKQGVCPETEADGTSPDWLWTYDDGSEKFKQKPPQQCYRDAVLHKALKAEQVSLDRNTVLNVLAAGRPSVFGFTVHRSFESQQMAKDGIMHVPQAFDIFDPQIGGHAITALGYALNKPMGSQGIKDWALIRNSWGSAWGVEGHFWMPLDQIMCNAQVASDAHTVDLVGV